MRQLLLSLFLLIITFSDAQQSLSNWKRLTPPDTVGTWIQPVQGKPAMPVWGHANGIIVGLAPLPGPRGLIRIYTPYLNYGFPEVMNFIAFEPIPRGAEERGYSELEKSSLDKDEWGKRFWSSDDAAAVLPLNEQYPARGIVEKIADGKSFTIHCMQR
ncbi:hypothetical protein [Proteiniphilum sp. X52]|uniref:hypothetical protein n=1 Tax=Proteiniphilum sp. X52 TaxID=2382159 RepID=UPI001C886E1C|nr:hypothetical protein [Proteiniphilum sp. X52]